MIYLDHAAATPVSTKVLAAMQPYFSTDFFNPSSAYLPAKKVAKAYEDAKNDIAHAIGAKGTDLIITSGATESNNLAFTSVNSSEKDEILYLETEHDSVISVAKTLNGRPLKVLKTGLIDLDDLKSKITPQTKLISISLVNNELGTIQPFGEISQIIKAERLRRLKSGENRPIFLHSDASQALNLLDLNVARLGIDLLTLNSAKIYGPKGVGALYLSHDVRLKPFIYGGGQENGLRSGTENVPGVIGFATAVKEAKKHQASNRKKYQALKTLFLNSLENYTPVNQKFSLDNFINICYENLDAERLIYLLEDYEIYLSTGAACAANKGKKSHVLKAIGLSDQQINGSLRITLGKTNDEQQIKAAASIINSVVNQEIERTKNV